MKDRQAYSVALFDSVSHVMKAEKILLQAGIRHKIIPVPRSISTDCGVCIRFAPELTEELLSALQSWVAVREIREL